jgi:hypothetical protein
MHPIQTRRRGLALLAALTLGGLGALASQAQAGATPPTIVMTGTWTGTMKCRGQSNGETTKFTFEGSMNISQSGNVLAVDTTAFNTGIASAPGFPRGAGTTHLCGTSQGTIGKDGQGQAALSFLDSAYNLAPAASLGDTWHAHLSQVRVSDADGSGSIKGTAVFEHLLGVFANCKIKLSRTNTIDQNVPTLPCE